MIEEGKRAPAFKLPSVDGGGQGESVSLSGFKGRYLVVYFYPKDDTPGCTLEAQGFSAAQKKLEKLDAAVVGVSKDTIAAHCKFRDKYKLKLPLLSDPDGKTIEAYGAWGEKNMYGKKSMGIIRSTVIIDPEGKVAKIFRKVKVDGHVDKVLETIAELRKAAKA